MTRRLRVRPGYTGLAIAFLYVAVALVTPRLTGRPLRPLFDGFAPPAPYAWVNPPPEFAKDNRKPADATQDVALGPDGSVASNATTSDGQAIAGLDVGSVPSHPPDTTVQVKLTPVDPGTLAPLPAGLRAEGNAYQVTLAYRPSGQAVTTLAKPGTIALTGAGPATVLLFSADGTAWQDVDGRPFGTSNGLFAPLKAPGYYLAASHNPGRATASGGGGSSNLLPLLLIVPVVGVVAALVTRRNRPSKKPATKARPGSGQRRPRGS